MKILIPYDGSKNTEIALNVLRRRADFAQDHEVLIAVSDVWLPESPAEFSRAVAVRRSKTAILGMSSQAPALRFWEDERVLSREARERIPSMFPFWDLRVETLPGFSLVSSEILEKAASFEADIIVIGSQNIFAAETTGYGAGALRIAKEAGCNVFIERETGFGEQNQLKENMPARIVLILDGTNRDAEIVQTATRRKWAKGSEALIIVNGAKHSSIEETSAVEMLRAVGLNVSVIKPESGSLSALVKTVLSCKADCIFIGDDGYANKEKGIFGQREFRSETEGLLRQTNCSVELVRKAQRKPKALSAAA